MKRQAISANLQGISDLTLLAPIKPGFVPAFDTTTYETRLRRVIGTLTALRSISREASPRRPISDSVERIQSIHSFRVTILEPEKRVLLAVTFDRGWEAYLRRVWWDLGSLLDLIFCNCAGYVPAYKSSYGKYVDWIRSAQVDSGFFYAASGMTVTDQQYLRQVEKLHRDKPGVDAEAAELAAHTPEQMALQAMQRDPQEGIRTGLRVLTALYRLTDFYRPDRLADDGDGGYLLRATQNILQEFNTHALPAAIRQSPLFKPQIDWFEHALPPRASDPDPESAPDREYDPSRVQGGILKAYGTVTHGCLALARVDDRDKARAYLAALQVNTDGSDPIEGVYRNVAFSHAGLVALGVPQSDLDALPREFVDGMEARAGLLGDVRTNHPSNWSLPERNWPDRGTAGERAERVQIGAIHVVVQLRCNTRFKDGDHELSGNRNHPLYAHVEALSQTATTGLQVLSVEAMVRYVDPQGEIRDHLGFVDGISQPDVDAPVPSTPPKWSDKVKRGEILRGYENDRGDCARPNALLDNGTFLVVRKLGLKVTELKDWLRKQAQALSAFPAKAPINGDQLLEKMIGRTANGAALVPGNPKHNAFDFAEDPAGKQCPFASHIRRTNPRQREGVHPVPRILRRGMSYGRRADPVAPGGERGLIFMAYNASIAEQFEVLQRWMSGGNSSGVFSGQGDPLLGVPDLDEGHTFRFEHAGEMRRLELGKCPGAPFARLEWGTYLFVPSLDALASLAQPVRLPADAELVLMGEAIIKKLQGLPEAAAAVTWKVVLEDHASKDSGATAAVWAAIRTNRAGVLRTPYGVLVGSHERVLEVFRNAAGRYSIGGYLPRMAESIGEIFLGLDKGSRYDAEAADTVRILMKVSKEAAFDVARKATDEALAAFPPGSNGRKTFDMKDLSNAVLAKLCAVWFGLPEGTFVEPGGWAWASDRKPRCPGDFTSPSRYIFSPNPAPEVKEFAVQHGKALTAAVTKLVTARRATGAPFQGLTAEIAEKISDDAQLARTIVGVMMGFLPTVDGSLRSALYELQQRDKSLWALQAAVRAEKGTSPYSRAQVILPSLARSMQARPVPDLVWRTVKEPHTLGNEPLVPNDRVVVGIVSATQEALGRGRVGIKELYPIFGGDRREDNPPTHACPAFDMAIGVLLGIFSGLLEAGTLLPTAAPLTFELAPRT